MIKKHLSKKKYSNTSSDVTITSGLDTLPTAQEAAINVNTAKDYIFSLFAFFGLQAVKIVPVTTTSYAIPIKRLPTLTTLFSKIKEFKDLKADKYTVTATANKANINIVIAEGSKDLPCVKLSISYLLNTCLVSFN
jgi:hypothetical protein